MAERAKKLPGNVNHLQKLVGAAADQRGMPPARLQHWLNAMVVMGTELDRVNGAQLDALQVPVPETVACVSVRHQVAQKLHACTEVFATGPENDRFRDARWSSRSPAAPSGGS